MPGTPGNVNALKTGRRSSRPGTVLARLGPRFSQCYQDVCRLRRGVESILKAKHGGVGLVESARVQSLCRLELNCRIAEQTIRETPAMPPDELRALRSLVGQWTSQRDNGLASLLGDGGGVADPWQALDASRGRGPHADAPTDNQAVPPADATTGIVGDSTGDRQ